MKTYEIILGYAADKTLITTTVDAESIDVSESGAYFHDSDGNWVGHFKHYIGFSVKN